MKSSYTNYAGSTYSLNENSIKISDIEETDKIMYKKAEELGKELDLDVFYCLKTFNDIMPGWKKARYFLIPIQRWEVERITKEYHANHWIGIYYNQESKVTQAQIEQEMSGFDYEHQCANYLERNGFYDVNVTQASGDQGIDIIAWKDSKKYGIQCKYYKGSVGNKAVQEAFTGAKFYNCDIAVVMTTGKYTSSAIELAHQIGVKLWEFIK